MSVNYEMFLSPDDQSELVDRLREVPDLIKPLALAIIRGDRRGLSAATSRPAPQSKPPVDHGAEALRDELHNCLTGWVRVVCDQRAMAVPEWLSTIGAADWLERNVTALAMTVGAEDAYRSIIGAIQAVQRRLDRPGDGTLSEYELAGANRMAFTAYQIEKFVHLLGEHGQGLNRRRVELLDKAGVLTPCDRDEDTGKRFYRLGDILAAHAIHPRRGAGSGS